MVAERMGYEKKTSLSDLPVRMNNGLLISPRPGKSLAFPENVSI
jgi:hypothetical protein